jgi:hypothetical protein
MAEATDQSITVICSCGKKLKAPANAVGRKARCKACGSILVIQKPEPVGLGSEIDIPLDEVARATGGAPTARKSSVQRPAEDDDDDGLGALYALEKEE